MPVKSHRNEAPKRDSRWTRRKRHNTHTRTALADFDAINIKAKLLVLGAKRVCKAPRVTPLDFGGVPSAGQ